MGIDAASIARLYTTIARLRQEGLSDAALVSVLQEVGPWDEAAIAVALGAPAALPAPTTPVVGTPEEPLQHFEKPLEDGTLPASELRQERRASDSTPKSISPIAATFHHIALWFFMGAAVAAVASLVASLLGSSSDDVATMTGFVATTVVTGVVYGVFYGFYLKQALRSPAALVPGKVFSIITLAFALVQTMAALIIFTVSLINSSWSDDSGASLISSGLIALVGLGILGTYWAAAIMPAAHRLRRALLIGGPLVVGVVIVGLLGVTLASIPAAVQDATTVKKLTTTVQSIEKYIDEEKRLPSEAIYSELYQASPEITYEPTAVGTYRLCATFGTDTIPDYSSSWISSEGGVAVDSSTAYEGSFHEHPRGLHCFTVENYELANPSSGYDDLLENLPAPGFKLDVSSHTLSEVS